MFLFSNYYLFALVIKHLITHITVKRNKQQHSLQVRLNWCEPPRHQITGKSMKTKCWPIHLWYQNKKSTIKPSEVCDGHYYRPTGSQSVFRKIQLESRINLWHWAVDSASSVTMVYTGNLGVTNMWHWKSDFGVNSEQVKYWSSLTVFCHAQ